VSIAASASGACNVAPRRKPIQCGCAVEFCQATRSDAQDGESEPSDEDGEVIPLYPVDLDGSWWSSKAQWPLDASWLRELNWIRGEQDPRGAAATVAKELVERSRDKPPDVAVMRMWLEARLKSAKIEDVVQALQGLALAFHVRAFEPRVEIDPGNLDRRVWGLDALPEARQTVNSRPDGSSRYKDLAEADFAYVRYMSEYIYAGPIVRYLNEQDPFGPQRSESEYLEEIADHTQNESLTLSSYITPGLQAFARFARASEKTQFNEAVGDLDKIVADMDAGRGGRNWSSVISILQTRADALIAAIRPFDSEFNSWRLRFPFSLANCQTFPEFLEGYSGIFQHYVRNLAQARPGTRVRLTYAAWTDREKIIRSLFPECFDFLNDASGDQQILTGQGISMPIANYADLVSNLSDVLAWAVRAKAGERALASTAEALAPGSGVDADDTEVTTDRMSEEELLKGLEGLTPPESPGGIQ
jgi:hypothetical protein